MPVWPLSSRLTVGYAARALGVKPGLAVLDGGSGPEGRFSYVAAEPDRVVRVEAGDSAASALERCAPPDSTDPDAVPSRVPHWIGHIAYGAAVGERASCSSRTALSPAPALRFARYPAIVAFDHQSGTTEIIGEAEPASRLARLLDGPIPGRDRARVRDIHAEDPARHLEAIRAALDHIGRGDIYQVNLTRAWTARLDGHPLSLYLAMRRASPVPFGFYVDGGDHVVLARTMERFLLWDRATGVVLTRPIKGTIARFGHDEVERARLANDSKERAEHAMIVDLMRNDLGRLAKVGTVRVREPFKVESYARLHHMVSTVSAVAREDTTLDGMIAATFPPGSVTGTPKARALEIIDQLERAPRGAYTGAVGYIDRAGDLSLAVAIRTAEVARGFDSYARGALLTYHAGGGIVEASDPARELAETELKARVFFDAVNDLERIVPPRRPAGPAGGRRSIIGLS